METSTLLAFIIAVIFFVLYYFRGQDLKVIKNRQEALQLLMQSQEIALKKEAETMRIEREALFKTEQLSIQLQEIALKKEAENTRIEREALFKTEMEALQSKLNDSYKTIPLLANQQFDEFKKKEIESLRAVLAEAASKTALADLEVWKIKYEMFYRQDAINRSQSVILGKVTEHLIPFHQNFPFNPKEARFIGSPIDMIVFDGIDNEDVVDIYILEIKTGNSSLNKRQRLIRDAVINKRIHWSELNL